MKHFGANTISNIAAKLWSLVSIYLFVPLYIKYLGESSYGLVSFFSVLQSALSILGLGLANTLRREFAVGIADDENNRIRKYKLLKSIETIYLFISIIIILMCFLGSDVISSKWLNVEELPLETVSKVISLMGICVALQFETGLYSGCLFGLNRQIYANSLQIGWAAAKSVGSVFIAYKYSNLELFYMWHCFTDLVYLLILRCSISRLLSTNAKKRWALKDFSNMKYIWKYTLGILIISIIALVNKQLDKVVISRYLTLTELGAYNVATTLGSLVSIIPSALYISAFPRFTEKVTNGKTKEAEKEFLTLNRIANIFICSMGAFIATFSSELINVWTGSDVYTKTLGFTGFFVVLAVASAEFQEIPYALALANGNTSTNIIVGASFLPFIFAVTFIVIKRFGLLGAGIVYFAFMVLQSLLYEYLIYKKHLSINNISTIIHETIIPLIICLLISGLCKYIVVSISLSPIVSSVIAIIMGMLTLIVLLFIYARKEINYLIKGDK